MLASTTSCRAPISKDESWKAEQSQFDKTSSLHGDPDFWKKAVTQNGQNEQAVFSRNGEKIYYISRDRMSHRQRQLYELDLKSKQEKRLTFQDGEVLEVVASPFEGSLFYSSTTDELKERPPLLFPESKNAAWPNTEIYRIRPDDDLHERWTLTPGFDGEMWVQNDMSKGPTLTWSHWGPQGLFLAKSTLQSNASEILLDRPGQWLHSYTTHPRGWKAWISEDPKTRLSQLVLLRKGSGLKEIPLNLYQVKHLWLWGKKEESAVSGKTEIPQQIFALFTGRASLDGPRFAYWIDIDRGCFQNVDFGPGEVGSLALSQNQEQILWSLSQGSTSQIFLDQFHPPTGLCRPLMTTPAPSPVSGNEGTAAVPAASPTR